MKTLEYRKSNEKRARDLSELTFINLRQALSTKASDHINITWVQAMLFYFVQVVSNVVEVRVAGRARAGAALLLALARRAPARHAQPVARDRAAAARHRTITPLAPSTPNLTIL